MASWPLGFAARRTIIQASSGWSLWWVIAIFYGKMMGKPWENGDLYGKYMFFEFTPSGIVHRRFSRAIPRRNSPYSPSGIPATADSI